MFETVLACKNHAAGIKETFYFSLFIIVKALLPVMN
jgi:hypothetical protein